MNERKKIGVLRANALGDVIVSLPAIESLKCSYPESEIILLGRENHREVLEGRVTFIDRYIDLPSDLQFEHFIDEKKHAGLLKSLREERFHLLLQMHGGGRNSNGFVNRLNPVKSVGAKTHEAESLSVNVPYTPFQHEVLRLLDIAQVAGGECRGFTPKLSFKESDKERGREILSPLGNKKVILLNPGAKDPKRRWPAERFGQLAEFLTRQGFQVVLNCSREERELALCIKEICPEVFFRPMNLSELIGVLSGSSLVVSNDTGTMHLALALGIPTLALYWHRNLLSYGPVSTQNCQPLISWETHCPQCGINCLADVCSHPHSLLGSISLDDVLKEVSQKLALLNRPS